MQTWFMWRPYPGRHKDYPMRSYLSALLAASAALFGPAAHALTADEAVHKLSPQEMTSYIGGAVEMLAYLDNELGACAIDWYFRSDGKGPHELVDALYKYPDVPVTGIIKELVKRHCKK
jgi:hypothetical protein